MMTMMRRREIPCRMLARTAVQPRVLVASQLAQGQLSYCGRHVRAVSVFGKIRFAVGLRLGDSKKLQQMMKQEYIWARLSEWTVT